MRTKFNRRFLTRFFCFTCFIALSTLTATKLYANPVIANFLGAITLDDTSAPSYTEDADNRNIMFGGNDSWHFTQPKGAANQSDDRWEFWSLSVTSAEDSGTVILRCLDEDKLGDGEKCSDTNTTRMTEERYTVCARSAQIPD